MVPGELHRGRSRLVCVCAEEKMTATGEIMRLHIGSGRKLISGWMNMDADQGIPGIDRVGSIEELGGFPDREFHEIYLSHVLEHIPHGHVHGVMDELYRILALGGRVRISVPDLDRICALYVQHIEWFTPPNTPWLGLLYGGQINEYDFHKGGFNFAYIKYLMQNAGFHGVTEVPPTEEYGVRDASFASRPFGPISLNVIGLKGDVGVRERAFSYSTTERVLGVVERVLELALSATVSLKLRAIRRRRTTYQRQPRR